MKLLCCICLHLPEEQRPEENDEDISADTVINGQAVCVSHAGYVQGGNFTLALAHAKGLK